MFKAKNLFFVTYLALTALIFLTFSASFQVYISFFISNLFLLLVVIYHLFYERDYSPFISSYIVFYLLFFLLAPISQINSFSGVEGSRLVNFFIYKENLVVYANTLIIIFNIIFICFYIELKKKILKTKNIFLKETSKKYLPVILSILLIISLLGFLSSYSFIKDEFFNPNWLKSQETSKAKVLINKKFIFMIPFTGLVLCIKYIKSQKKQLVNYIIILAFFVIFFMLLFWFKNPLTEKRNALGPLYICLIFLFFPKLLNSNVKTLSFLFFSMIIVFPLTAIITHSDATLAEIYNNPLILINQMKGGGIIKAFNTLNYDAFFNFTASIDYVDKNGFSFGYQLLGGLLFFVPRSFWTSKPVSSGELVGDYLVNDFGFNFTNLSNPYVSEGFLNFGLIGVIIYPIILAYVLIIMLQWIKSKNHLKRIMSFYFAMHLLFFLRGDFTNGFSYYIAPLIAVVYLPNFIEFIIKNIVKR